MVLAELGGSIRQAFRQMSNATEVDENVMKDCLIDITRALLQSDVELTLVAHLQNNIRNIVNLEKLAAGLNKRKIIEKAVFHELCRLLDAGKPCFIPVKKKQSVVMFVGLQGSGKTTTCTKYASYYQNKGFQPALVCADTFRAGAFDQLKQNANKANIPFYGSYTESDPVTVAVQGLECFNKLNYDLIVIDTSGRHRQEAALFEEMRQLYKATKPDLVVFVMDGSIGKAAFSQAQAFKQSVAVGAVIVTKLDGHAKGGGALSAVAATKSPVIFIGTGEHINDFKQFDANSFVGRLIGLQGHDLRELKEKVDEMVPEEKQVDLAERLMSGNLTLRSMYDMYHNMFQTRNLSSLGDELRKMKHYMIIMDSMTDKELDNSDPKLLNESRIMRIARGSGSKIQHVKELMEKHKQLSKMKGIKNPQQLIKRVPPQILQQIGGIAALQNFRF
ncbi:signal recognition particle subunit SRP54 3-like [Mercurialis annua]|uniref:signal recognition particle subunit SRP54 3-like n=1 Tax=Mercurialis annua TaxID=3986 RepID=UPI00215F4BFF|nr:signal recognition particle subunit SRP54 3-like [Mercurialis annua]